jgi:hypothetical protein
MAINNPNVFSGQSVNGVPASSLLTTDTSSNILGVGAGTNGQVLKADSTQASGVSWNNIGSSVLLVPDGTASAPGYAFTNETNSGMYRVGTSNIGIAVAGTEGIDIINIGASLVNFGFGAAANPGSSQPVVYSRTLNNDVYIQYINPSTGTASSMVMQIAGGTSSNYLTLENRCNNTTAYIGQGSCIFSSPNQTQLIIGSEGTGTFIGYTVGGRTLSKEVFRMTSTTAQTTNTHLKTTQTTAPTATVNANAGTGATSTVTSATDNAGILNLTLGAIATLSSGAQTDVNFHTAYGVAPIVVLTPTNATTATNIAAFGVYVTSTTAKFTLNFATAGAATDVLQWNYHVIETQ